MTLRTLVSFEQALTELGRIKFPNGGTAFRLSKALRPYLDEIEEYRKLRDRFIVETGKTELRPADPEFAGVARKLSEALAVDIQIENKYKFSEADFATVELTVEQARALQVLGLIEEQN